MRARPPWPGASLEVRGEFSHWSFTREPMTSGPDGWCEAELALSAGVYEYKFRAGEDAWLLDPHNPRTRWRGAARNSVLVVGGTDEPVLHAPTRPDVFVEDDGRLCVRAALRKGSGNRLTLLWSEGSTRCRTEMRAVGSEREHDLFEVHVPGSGRRVTYWFELADGRLVGASGAAGQGLVVDVARATPAAPDWWRDAIVYSVFVDRFRPGNTGGAWRDASRSDRDWRAGGDLIGVREALPYLADLGVNTLHLTPICAAGSVHRYDAVDPRRTADELGGDSALVELLAHAHRRDIRVIVDVALTHVHRDFFAFRDVRERGPASRYWPWFFGYRFPFGEGDRPGYEHYQKGEWHLPLLRTTEPEVQDYLVGTFEHWADMGVDGFRLDAAADVPRDLVASIGRAVRARNPKAALFAEIIPEHGEQWTRDGVHAATDFASQEVLLDWLVRDKRTATDASAELERRRFRSGGPGWTRLALCATHDQPRLATRCDDARDARLGLLHTLLRAPVPLLYYGDEVGLRSTEPDREFEDAWPDRAPMPWRPERWDAQTLAVARKAIALRKEHDALRRGDDVPFDTGHPNVVGWRRQTGHAAGRGVIDVLLHRGQTEATVALQPGDGATSLLTLGDVRLQAGQVTLGPKAAVVIDRRPPTTELGLTLRSHNAALAAHAYERGDAVVPALPARLYITITEACNLRCRHCITEAPALTRSGRARTIAPWVIDALGPALAAADYIGFVHGGESLVSRRLFDVLAAVDRARASTPGRPDIHLVSNGMLLDAEMTERLIDRGVNSIMVSIDGATPETNDRIRVAGKLTRVCANISAALAVRERRGADLRIGISSVIGASNLAEVESIARLAASLGVDWLKLEETYAVNGFARGEAVDPRAPALRRAVDRARRVCEADGLVFVDHVAPPTGCGCQAEGDDSLRAFRTADDFANRARFSACRAAWEQACVDPDGTVRPVDYAREPAGSLLDAPFEDLWNAPSIVAARHRLIAESAADERRRCVESGFGRLDETVC